MTVGHTAELPGEQMEGTMAPPAKWHQGLHTVMAAHWLSRTHRWGGRGPCASWQLEQSERRAGQGSAVLDAATKTPSRDVVNEKTVLEQTHDRPSLRRHQTGSSRSRASRGGGGA